MTLNEMLLRLHRRLGISTGAQDQGVDSGECAHGAAGRHA